MGHWTPTGVEPRDYEDNDDDDISSSNFQYGSGRVTTVLCKEVRVG